MHACMRVLCGSGETRPPLGGDKVHHAVLCICQHGTMQNADLYVHAAQPQLNCFAVASPANRRLIPGAESSELLRGDIARSPPYRQPDERTNATTGLSFFVLPVRLWHVSAGVLGFLAILTLVCTLRAPAFSSSRSQSSLFVWYTLACQ